MSEKIRITVFGSAAGFPTLTRTNTSSLALWVGGDLYLVDVGEGVSAQFSRLNISPEALRAIFITHPHCDHLAGLPLLVQWHILNGRGRPLPVHLPADFLQGVRDFLYLCFLYPVPEFELDLREVKAGDVHDEFGITVEALSNRHFQPNAERRREQGMRAEAQSYSYRFTLQGKQLFFSGDLAEAGEAALAQGSDLAFVELTHFTPEKLGETLTPIDLPRLVVTHIKDTYESSEAEIPARIKGAGFGGEVWVAHDGEEFSL